MARYKWIFRPISAQRRDRSGASSCWLRRWLGPEVASGLNFHLPGGSASMTDSGIPEYAARNPPLELFVIDKRNGPGCPLPLITAKFISDASPPGRTKGFDPEPVEQWCIPMEQLFG